MSCAKGGDQDLTGNRETLQKNKTNHYLKYAHNNM